MGYNSYYPIVHGDQADNYISLLLSISATSSFHAYITNMLPHHHVAIWQLGIENNTEGRQSVNHLICKIFNHTIAMKKICVIKSMAPLQHNDTAITDSII